MKKNASSYFPLKMFCKSAPDGILVGPTEFRNEQDFLYPERRLRLNSTIIWIPGKQAHIGLASYVDAQKNGDEAAIAKLKELGIPLGIRFSDDNDFSGTYDVVKEDKPQRGEEVAKAKLVELGIPLNARFGYSPSDDLTSTYVVRSPDAPRRGRRPGSGPVVKVMRAKFAQRFEDGTEFKAGDVVKITFRGKFVKNDGGSKTFQNVYERPSKDELEAFLADEAKTR